MDEEQKKIAEDVEALNDAILENWKSVWNFQTKDSDVERYCFLGDVVEKNYKYFKMKADCNRKENFEEKDQFITNIIRAGVVGGVILAGAAVVWAAMKWETSQLATFVVFLSAILAIVFYAGWKKIEVHKKQETWARHHDALGMLQDEMMRYYLGVAPYNEKDMKKNNDNFADNILKAFALNRKKFVDNMENKEAKFSEVSETVKFHK